LAKITNWDEEFLTWRLPLPRFLQYEHADMREEGHWTVIPSAPAEDQFYKLLQDYGG
jgi:hypothetical protein